MVSLRPVFALRAEEDASAVLKVSALRVHVEEYVRTVQARRPLPVALFDATTVIGTSAQLGEL